MRQDQAHERVHDLIYNAAIQPELWRDVLAYLQTAIGAESGAVSRLSVVDGSGAAIAAGADSSVLDDYFNYYAAINPLVRVADPAGYAREWQPAILRDEDTLPRDELERSEYYNDFLRHIGAAWGMGIRLGLQGTDLYVIDLGRSAARGRFEADEIAVVERLHPHLIRAHALGRRFASLQGLKAGLIEGLDRANEAMMLLDGDGTLLYANAAGERGLSSGDRLRLTDGRLVASDPRIEAALGTAIAQASASHDRTANTLMVPGSDGTALALTVAPLCLEEASIFARGAAVLVTITDPTRRTGLSRERLIETFGLTRAEARLADALVSGLSLRAASDRYGISIHTARTQLASVFSKTDTHRQLDLVRVLETAEPAH